MLNQQRQIKHRRRERGFVLIIVLMLVLLFTGLGLLAMRHARQELRATGAYFDHTQAAMLAESAMAMAATDLRRSSEYYQSEFGTGANVMDATSAAAVDIWTTKFAIPLNNTIFSDAGTIASTVCITPTGPADRDGCVDLLSSPFINESEFGAEYYTTLTYDAPLVGPCPPGFSCFDDQNYGWYIFGVHATARYGPPSAYLTQKFVSYGRASGYGQFTIGPIGAYGR